MRYLFIFLFIYCLVAVLAEIPDTLRRVKRNELNANKTISQIKEFSKVNEADGNGNKAELKNGLIENKGLKDNVDSVKGATVVGNSFKNNFNGHRAMKPGTPLGLMWRDHSSHKRQHFNDDTLNESAVPVTNFAQPHHKGSSDSNSNTVSAIETQNIPKSHLRHFRQGLPYTNKNRNYPGHMNRNKKKAFGGKRKTVLVLHTPHTAKFITNDAPRHLADDLIKEEIQQLELENDGFIEPLQIFKATRDPKKASSSAAIQHVGFFDLPVFPVDSTNPENRYSTKTAKRILDPVDNFMKIANMMMYKVGVDDGTPYHAQTTHITATPEMLISASATNNALDNIDLIDPEHNFFSDENEHGESREYVKPIGNNKNTFGTLEFSPPIKLNDNPKEPKKLLTLIENALDTMLKDDDDQQEDSNEEIEVHCPIHHAKAGNLNKKSHGLSSDESDRLGGDVALQSKNDVMEVCQCHFIKRKKDAKH